MAADPGRPVQVWTSPVLVLPGGVVQLQPEVAALVAGTLEAYARMEKVSMSPLARQLVESCSYAASLADRGHPDVRNSTESAESVSWSDPAAWMTTSEAAERLGCTPRHVSRLARDGLLGASRLARGKRLVLRAEVLARTAA